MKPPTARGYDPAQQSLVLEAIRDSQVLSQND